MKFWDALMRRSREADAVAAQKIDVSNPEKQRQVIEDANSELNDFEGQLRELGASRILKERQVAGLVAEVAKYEGFASRAGAAKDEPGVREAVTKKLASQKNLDTLNAEIAKDTALETKLKAQLRDSRDKVATVESQAQSLRTRETSAKIRQGLANNSTSKTGSALSQLDEWGKAVDRQEALAQAGEEIDGATSVDQDLEKKYGGTNEAVDAEMAKYLKPAAPASANA